ncbi:hypothetical protein ACLOJK_035024 [Asimina triloba]
MLRINGHLQWEISQAINVQAAAKINVQAAVEINGRQQAHGGPHNSILAASRAGQRIVKLNCIFDHRAEHGSSNVIAFKEADGINFLCRHNKYSGSAQTWRLRPLYENQLVSAELQWRPCDTQPVEGDGRCCLLPVAMLIDGASAPLAAGIDLCGPPCDADQTDWVGQPTIGRLLLLAAMHCCRGAAGCLLLLKKSRECSNRGGMEQRLPVNAAVVR